MFVYFLPQAKLFKVQWNLVNIIFPSNGNDDSDEVNAVSVTYIIF